jgi:hypothetical protein
LMTLQSVLTTISATWTWTLLNSFFSTILGRSFLDLPSST